MKDLPCDEDEQHTWQPEQGLAGPTGIGRMSSRDFLRDDRGGCPRKILPSRHGPGYSSGRGLSNIITASVPSVAKV